jgi:uncharacterized protein with HEPN domain
MKRETAKRLPDARSACDEVMAYCQGRTRNAFLADRTLNIVVAHLTLTIGEAMRQAERTDPTLIDHIPQLRDIVDTRNRIVHAYDRVNYSLLWDIVQDDLPPLQETLARLLLEAPPLDDAPGR